jgi:hypothetical protein
MAKKPYFNNYDITKEQWLYDSLVRESIDIYGEEMMYIPRTLTNYDPVYGADDQSSYSQAIMIPIYIENVKGFGGDGTLMGKFGIEVRDRMSFSVSQSVFSEEVGTVTNQTRPNEGDLVFFPLNNKCFQIKYVEKFEMFYPLGALYTWKMECELFEYSNEIMNTGIPQIDSLQKQFSQIVTGQAGLLKTETNKPILTENSFYIMTEGLPGDPKPLPGDDSEEIEKEAAEFVDFSIEDPFSEKYFEHLKDS